MAERLKEGKTIRKRLQKPREDFTDWTIVMLVNVSERKSEVSTILTDSKTDLAWWFIIMDSIQL